MPWIEQIEPIGENGSNACSEQPSGVIRPIHGVTGQRESGCDDFSRLWQLQMFRCTVQGDAIQSQQARLPI